MWVVSSKKKKKKQKNDFIFQNYACCTYLPADDKLKLHPTLWTALIVKIIIGGRYCSAST